MHWSLSLHDTVRRENVLEEERTEERMVARSDYR